MGNWKDPFQARGGLLGGFIQGRTKEVDDFVSEGLGVVPFWKGIRWIIQGQGRFPEKFNVGEGVTCPWRYMRVGEN